MIHDYKESPIFRDDMTFGEVVRKKRRLMGLNQLDFGNKYGIDQGTVCRWERGVTSPAIEDARYVLKRLGAKLIIRNNKGNDPKKKEIMIDAYDYDLLMEKAKEFEYDISDIIGWLVINYLDEFTD